MNKINMDTKQVGWVITHADELGGSEDRIGFGQLLAEADATQESHDRVIGRTIYVSRNLSYDDIPEDQRVRWRSFDDDGEPSYRGVVRLDWLFGEDEMADAAYNIDRFNMTDVGAVIVLYSGEDIVRCDESKLDFVNRHPRMGRRMGNLSKDDLQGWLPIYG